MGYFGVLQRALSHAVQFAPAIILAYEQQFRFTFDAFGLSDVMSFTPLFARFRRGTN